MPEGAGDDKPWMDRFAVGLVAVCLVIGIGAAITEAWWTVVAMVCTIAGAVVNVVGRHHERRRRHRLSCASMPERGYARVNCSG